MDMNPAPSDDTERSYLDKWFPVFRAGDYPQGKFTITDVNDIGMNYDPSFCEAPVWIGHPDDGEALAWVYKCRPSGDTLEVQFSSIDEELINLINRKRYKYSSVELMKFAEKPGWYLVAIGLTNRPQVKGLEPLDQVLKDQKFNEHVILQRIKFTAPIRIKFQTSDKNLIKNISKTNNQTEMKIEDIKKFAEGKDIDLTACTTDAQVIEAVDKYITKVETERDIATEQVTKFTEEKTSMEERIAKLEEGNLSAVIKMGIIAKKVLPTEEAQLITFGKSQGFIELQKLINDRPVLGVFAADTVDKKEPGGKIDLAAKKFQNEDGTPLTWKQFSEKVHKNPAFADQFTVEEQEAIKAGTAVTV